jgi:hypothetical protein
MAAENTPFTSCSCENTKSFIIPTPGTVDSILLDIISVRIKHISLIYGLLPPN